MSITTVATCLCGCGMTQIITETHVLKTRWVRSLALFEVRTTLIVPPHGIGSAIKMRSEGPGAVIGFPHLVSEEPDVWMAHRDADGNFYALRKPDGSVELGKSPTPAPPRQRFTLGGRMAGKSHARRLELGGPETPGLVRNG